MYAATVPLLADEQLRQLGVARMGDRAALVQACKRTCLGKSAGHGGRFQLLMYSLVCPGCTTGSRISQEVRRIMQPSLPATGTGSGAGRSSAATNTFPSGSVGEYRIPIEHRRSKRRQSTKRMSLCTSNAPAPARQQSFSKKLFVFRHMEGAPKSFTRKDKDIIARGFVSDIYIHATEEEVREEIRAVLMNSGLPSQMITRDVFEFIDVNGKLAFVPSIKEGFEFNGRVIKQLAGAGSLYVRLLQNLPLAEISDSDDDHDLPPVPFTVLSSNTPGSSQARSPSDDHIQELQEAVSFSDISGPSRSLNDDAISFSDTPGPSRSLNDNAISFSDTPGPSRSLNDNAISFSDTPGPSRSLNDDAVSFSDTPGPSRSLSDVQQLQEAFSNFPPQFISVLYSITNCDFVETFDCLLKGDLLSILNLVKTNLMKSDADDTPNIRVPGSCDEHDWPIAAFSFYKSSRFEAKAGVNVILGGQPAIDIGGVRRTFFSIVYEKVISGYLDMFEGPSRRLRPAFKISILNSGILQILGQMIGHTLLMDGIGFPYLSPPCYYYMAGKWNTAITFITDEDVSSRVRHVLKQVWVAVMYLCLGNIVFTTVLSWCIVFIILYS